MTDDELNYAITRRATSRAMFDKHRARYINSTANRIRKLEGLGYDEEALLRCLLAEAFDRGIKQGRKMAKKGL